MDKMTIVANMVLSAHRQSPKDDLQSIIEWVADTMDVDQAKLGELVRQMTLTKSDAGHPDNVIL